jgi:hypothetical protein
MEKLKTLFTDPPNPYLVLAVAILLPGMGHVLVGETRRGLTMQMFMISLAFITWHLTTPAQSLVGRLAGGLFVYAISIPEAYRLAKLRSVRAAAGGLKG